jgi:hypothetical protein
MTLSAPQYFLSAGRVADYRNAIVDTLYRAP